CVFFFYMIRPPPRSTPFPYPTLFRSPRGRGRLACTVRVARRACGVHARVSRETRVLRQEERDERQAILRPRDRRRPRDREGEERSEEHTSELQSQSNLVCRLLLEKKK